MRAALERGVTPEVISFHLRGLRGSPLGVPGLSGVHVTLNPAAPSGHRVGHVTVDGEPLNDDQVYRVGHSDLETDEASFLTAPDVRQVHADYTVLIEDVVREYLHQHSPVTPNGTQPWQHIDQLVLGSESQ